MTWLGRSPRTIVELSLQTPDNRRVVVSTDHVIAATGYRVDIRRLEFLNAALISQIACVHETPILSTRFESLGQRSVFYRAHRRQQLRPSDAFCLWCELRVASPGSRSRPTAPRRFQFAGKL